MSDKCCFCNKKVDWDKSTTGFNLLSGTVWHLNCNKSETFRGLQHSEFMVKEFGQMTVKINPESMQGLCP